MSEIRQAALPEVIKRQRVNFNNAAGDVVPKKNMTHEKCKSTIPKNLRYDLENALVGLCDVWFEEIKPYLVRNNIKLHRAPCDAGGDLKRCSASNDCTHTDPGRSNRPRLPSASCADSSSMQRTASRAPCRKPLVLRGSPITMEAPIQHHNMKKETVRKPRKRRKSQTQAHPRQLIPRLCHTYSKQRCDEVNPIINNAIKIPARNITRCSQQKRKTLDVSTQTPGPMKDMKKSDKLTPNMNFKMSKFARCPAVTNIFYPKLNKHHTEAPLFKEDLVDIIAEKHDKILKVLFTSPRRENHPSVMNLYSPSEDLHKSMGNNRIPWK